MVPRILIVDDEKDIVGLLACNFEKDRCEFMER
jgi:DNA-binding response OmpR family regulator